MCGIIIVILLILIVCTIRAKLSMIIHELHRQPPVLVMPMGSFKDLTGKKIKGKGLTPLTTPGRRSCAQLMVPNSQETSSIRPDDP